MPPLSYEGVDELYAKKLINGQERSMLRQRIFKEQQDFESLSSRYVTSLSKEVQDNWANLVLGIKDISTEFKSQSTIGKGETKYGGFFEIPAAQVALHALSLLTSWATAGGHALGEGSQDILLKRGVNPNVAAIVATLVDIGASAKILTGAGKGVIKAGEAVGFFKKDPAVLNALDSIITDSTVKKAEAFVAEKQNPANLVNVIRPGQDIALPGKAGKMISERKLLSPPEADKEALATAERKMQKMNDTHDLLTQAQESITPSSQSETQKTLDAAAATLRGGLTSEQIVNEAQQVKARMAAEDLLAAASEAKQKGLLITGGAPSPEDYVKQFSKTVKEYGDLLKQYQGHGLTYEEASKQADKLLSKGYSLDDVMAIMPQEAKNPAQTLAVVKTAMPLAEEILNLKDAARSGNNEAFIKILGDFSNLFAVNPRYFGIRSTAGQTLGIYRDPTFGKTKFLEQFHEMASWLGGMELNSMDDIMRNKDRILSVLDNFKTPEQLISHGLTKPEALRPGWLETVAGYFAQNLLSPLVLTKKIFGDTAATLYRPLIEKPMESIIYKGLSRFSENPLGLTINDVPVGGESVANLYGYRRGWMRAWDYLRSGDLTGLAEQTGQGALSMRMSLSDILNERFGQPGAIFGDIVGAIPNSIKILTNAARLAAFESEASGLLWRQGVQLGKTGAELESWVEMGMRNLPPDIMKKGLAFADEATFTDAPGAFAQWVQSGLKEFPSMKFELPFWRIPFNLMRWGYQRSPILSLTSIQNLKDLSGGGIEAVDAASKILIGNIVGGGLIMGGYAGWITGSGPNDPRVRSEMIQSGAFKPFSIWNPIEGNWFDYSLMHPIKPILGTAADLGFLWNQLPWNEGAVKNMENAFSAFAAATARNFGENPFFAGITNTGKTVEEIMSGQLGMNKAMERSLGNFITGFIPLGATLRYTAQTLDPSIKEVHSVMDVVESSIPVLKSDLFPKRDIYGRPEMLPDVYGPRMFSILRSRSGEEDPVAKEDLRLQMSFGDQGDHIFGPIEATDPTKIIAKTGVPLNPNEQDFRDQRLGELYHQNAQEMQNSPDYGSLPDVEKIRQRRNIRGLARTQATYETIDKFPDLEARVNEHLQKGDISIPTDSTIGQTIQDSQAIRETEQKIPEFFPLEMGGTLPPAQ